MSNGNQKEFDPTVDRFFNMMGLNTDKETKEHSDIDWIFSNGKDVLKHEWKSSIVALAKYMEVEEKEMWGSHGEGMFYVDVCKKILKLARPFLLSKNKKGYIDITYNILRGNISTEDVHKSLELELEKGEMI